MLLLLLQFAPAIGSLSLASQLAGYVYQQAIQRHGQLGNTCRGQDCFQLTFLVGAALFGSSGPAFSSLGFPCTQDALPCALGSLRELWAVACLEKAVLDRCALATRLSGAFFSASGSHLPRQGG
jgi:hypothetical protein